MAEFDPYEYIPELINDEYYIKPGTDVFILRGVPLDNTYEHTIVWENLDANRTQQRDYFLSKVKFGIPANSYQRVDRFWLKVNVNAEYLMDCNYIMFKNTPFNMVKWYYGFITEVEYINNNTSKIRYELDVMQTWLPGQYMDYQMLPCFVERCHAMSDELYENLIPESIVNSNDYMTDQIYRFNMSDMCIITLASERYSGNNEFTPATGREFYNVYGAVDVRLWGIKTDVGMHDTVGTIDGLNNYIKAFINAGKENSILAIFMFPKKLLTWSSDYNDWPFPDIPAPGDLEAYQLPYIKKYTITELIKPKKGQTLGGSNSSFIPKNNKLYSYPYNRISVKSQDGNEKIFLWELFDGDSRGIFEIDGTYCWQGCVVTYPRTYKNASKDLSNSVSFNNFPICAWASDAYRAWWAQNTANMVTTVGGGVASIAAIIAGGLSDNPMLIATGVGGVISAGTKIGQSLYEANHKSTNEYGDTKTANILPRMNCIEFLFLKQSLRSEILQIYDDYFTRFGYAQKKVMYPRLVARERWTYVQTVGFEFNGEINDTDTKKIKSIFDNGITFWRNPDEVGHYELDNKPLV